MTPQNEQSGGNLLTLTEHSKMFIMLEPVSRGLGKKVPGGLSEQFPEHMHMQVLPQ